MGEAKVRSLNEEASKGITVTYKDMGKRDFHDALQKLDNFTKWKDPKDIHRFNKLKNTIDREHKKAGLWYKKLVDRHVEMETKKEKHKITGEMVDVIDPKTKKPVQKPKMAPNPDTKKMDLVFKDPDAFEKDLNVMHAQAFTVKVYKFLTEDLVGAELTPGEIRAVSMMVKDIDKDLLLEDDDPSEDELNAEIDAIIGSEAPQEEAQDGGDSDQPAN